ncbi:MAG: hypothetical protein ACHQHL_04575 [Steroidobacterales bacterium]
MRSVPVLVLALLGAVFVAPAAAQAPPYYAYAYVADAKRIDIAVTWCPIGDAPSCATDTYYIYRNPPAFTTPPITRYTSQNGDRARFDVLDDTVTPNTTYSYLVCSGERLSDESNCLQTSPLFFPVSSSPPPSSGGSPAPNSGPSGYPPPANLSLMPNLSPWNEVFLAWDDAPGTGAPYTTIARSFTGEIAFAIGQAPVRSMRERWTDAMAVPHRQAFYQVCTGALAGASNNCVGQSVSTYGPDPVLSVTRDPQKPGTVHLVIAVDDLTPVTAYFINRSDAAAACATLTKGTNGGPACRTRSYGPNGVPLTNGITTVAEASSLKLQPCLLTPCVIRVDDTVNPGDQYTYTAYVTWFNSNQQASEPVTLSAYHPNLVAKTVAPLQDVTRYQIVGTRAAPGKVGPTGASRSAVTKSVDIAQAVRAVSAKPHDQNAIALTGRAYCATGNRSLCIHLLYMALIQASNHGDASTQRTLSAELRSLGIDVSQ